MDKLTGFYEVQNIIFKRDRFIQRNRQIGKSEEYIMLLHNLVETCGYKELTEEILCKRMIVASEMYVSLSKSLQMNPIRETIENSKKNRLYSCREMDTKSH